MPVLKVAQFPARGFRHRGIYVGAPQRSHTCTLVHAHRYSQLILHGKDQAVLHHHLEAASIGLKATPAVRSYGLEEFKQIAHGPTGYRAQSQRPSCRPCLRHSNEAGMAVSEGGWYPPLMALLRNLGNVPCQHLDTLSCAVADKQPEHSTHCDEGPCVKERQIERKISVRRRFASAFLKNDDPPFFGLLHASRDVMLQQDFSGAETPNSVRHALGADIQSLDIAEPRCPSFLRLHLN